MWSQLRADGKLQCGLTSIRRRCVAVTSQWPFTVEWDDWIVHYTRARRRRSSSSVCCKASCRTQAFLSGQWLVTVTRSANVIHAVRPIRVILWCFINWLSWSSYMLYIAVDVNGSRPGERTLESESITESQRDKLHVLRNFVRRPNYGIASSRVRFCEYCR